MAVIRRRVEIADEGGRSVVVEGDDPADRLMTVALRGMRAAPRRRPAAVPEPGERLGAGMGFTTENAAQWRPPDDPLPQQPQP